MGFSFKDTQEEVAKVGVKASVGIHEFKIKEIKVEEIKGKDGKDDWEKGSVIFEVIKSNIAKDLDYSIGKTIEYSILFPKDQEGAEKLGKRLIHIFSKVSTKDKIDTIKEAIKKLDLTSIKTLIEGLKKIAEGRSLRLKIVADQEGKYPMIPLYYQGYAETIDTNPSQLTFDESKEGLTKKDSNKVENTKEEDSDDLPW